MIESFLLWIDNRLSLEFMSFLLASVPLTESRAAIPIAITLFHLSPLRAFLFTFFGNLIPIPFVFFFLKPILSFVHVYVPSLDQRFYAWRERQQKKYGSGYSRWGAFFLFLFVVFPGPGTGVWTGSVLAVLFKINPRVAIPCLVAGAFVGGLLILGITTGIVSGLSWLL